MVDLAYEWIWMLTDYGQRDGFVAACRGVVARIAPTVRVADITHDVPAGDVRHGAVVLAQTVPYLPPSVVVAVVDPGVGGSRRGLALAAGASILVGPDNGLLLWAADVLGGVTAAVEPSEPAYHLPSPAHTFHGRDVFAPVAAHLAAGVALSALGSALAVDDLARLRVPRVEIRAGVLETEVLAVDRFGNVQLAARDADLQAAGLARGPVEVAVRDRAYAVVLASTFGDVAAGDLIVFVDSAGHIAIAVNGGAAAAELGLSPGDAVLVTRLPEPTVEPSWSAQ
ncbi:MAG TPA: SAM-dependent chlorinase/fluorinase [Jiangellaceae bacterium]|nr:SAM-dependent chlorinase/fluorinase [Jiangellaceae bacterium]